MSEEPDVQTLIIDQKQRTCQECGMLCDQPGEFHPYMFCVLKKAGLDPWAAFKWEVEHLTGAKLPTRPPAVRDIPSSLPPAGTEGTT